MLVAVEATGDSATVVADVTLTPVREACEAPSPCPFGTITLPGLAAVDVTAANEVRALYPNSTAPIAGPLALQLGSAVALLGTVSLPNGQLVVPVRTPALRGADTDARGVVFAVNGWLIVTSFPCPSEPPLPTDSPFDPCGHSYLMNDPADADNGPPGNDIAVQRSAYETFAANPVMNTYEPRQGAYLIRQVKDPRPSCKATCYGWLMVGRIDPVQ